MLTESLNHNVKFSLPLHLPDVICKRGILGNIVTCLAQLDYAQVAFIQLLKYSLNLYVVSQLFLYDWISLWYRWFHSSGIFFQFLSLFLSETSMIENSANHRAVDIVCVIQVI
jgi:hypothetical protein